MWDYARGDLAAPCGFDDYYKPETIFDSKAGPRLVVYSEGDGCSTPSLAGLLVDTKEGNKNFEIPCRVHDYLYDLLRHANLTMSDLETRRYEHRPSIGERHGPLVPVQDFVVDDRHDADGNFGSLMRNVCGETGYFGWNWRKTKCYDIATAYEAAVRAWTLVEGRPTGRPG